MLLFDFCPTIDEATGHADSNEEPCLRGYFGVKDEGSNNTCRDFVDGPDNGVGSGTGGSDTRQGCEVEEEAYETSKEILKKGGGASQKRSDRQGGYVVSKRIEH